MMYRILAAAILSAAAAYAGVSIADRQPPTELQSITAEPFNVESAELRLHYKVLRHRICHLHRQVIIFDSQRTRWFAQDQTADLAPGFLGPDEFTVPVMLPERMAAGAATAIITNRYECNWTHYFWPVLVGPIEVKFNVPVENREWKRPPA
jgi:hypothetical protein